MENLTHTLTGLMLSRAGLDRLTPRAAWVAAIAANIPDMDAVTVAAGAETYFRYHRGFTHSLLCAPFIAIVPVLVVAAAFRTRLPWVRAWLLSFIAVLSHLLLDFTNPYGIRLFLPFSDAWPGLDSTHVVDIWIWVILLTGLCWPMLSGLVSSEIGANRSKGRGMAVAALVLLALYDTGRFFLHERAMATLQSRVYDGAAPRRVVAFPGNFTPLRWKGWVETERSWIAVDVDLTQEFDPEPVATYWLPETQAAVDLTRPLPLFQQLSAFAKTPYWRVTPSDQGTRVELIDLRFGRNGRLGFTATAVFDAAGHLAKTSFHY